MNKHISFSKLFLLQTYLKLYKLKNFWVFFYFTLDRTWFKHGFSSWNHNHIHTQIRTDFYFWLLIFERSFMEKLNAFDSNLFPCDVNVYWKLTKLPLFCRDFFDETTRSFRFRDVWRVIRSILWQSIIETAARNVDSPSACKWEWKAHVRIY